MPLCKRGKILNMRSHKMVLDFRDCFERDNPHLITKVIWYTEVFQTGNWIKLYISHKTSKTASKFWFLMTNFHDSGIAKMHLHV